jgi:hypothetical protein
MRSKRLLPWFLSAGGIILAVLLLLQPLSAYLSLNRDFDQQPAGQILLLNMPEQSFHHYYPLTAGLRLVGYRTTIIDVPAESEQEMISNIRAVIEPSAHLWLVAFDTGDEAAWRAARQIKKIDGIFLLAPSNLKALTDLEPIAWPPDWTTVVLNNDDAGSDFGSRRFFEWLSGEDADLFPPMENSFLAPNQYASADGKTWLILYPGLISRCSRYSPRSLSATVGWFADLSASRIDAPKAKFFRAASQSVLGWFGLLLSGLVLLALPQAINLALAKNRNKIPEPASGGLTSTAVEPDQYNGSRRNLVLLLPALILAATIGLVIAFFLRQWRLWQIPAILIAPGIWGWIVWNDRRLSVPFTRPLSDSARRLPRLNLTGLIFIILTIGLAFGWVILTSGVKLERPEYFLPMLILVLVSWAAGLVGAPGLSRGPAAVIGYLPVILWTIAGVSMVGWVGLPAGIWLLLARWWSFSLGLAAFNASGKSLLGGLFQGLAWSTVLLCPFMISILPGG